MPSLEEMDRHQRAVLWTLKTGRSRYDKFGNPVTDAPVEVWVRWIDGVIDTLRPDGTPLRLDAQVIADQDIPIGSVMWLAVGCPDDDDAVSFYYSEGSGGEDTGLMTVETRKFGLDLKGREDRWEFGLSKFMDTPATQG